MPIPTEHPHSSLLKDKPMFCQYLGNNERSEMHKPWSPIMPPIVVAMWDTEIGRESFDARPNNYRNDDPSTTFSPKIGLMGGTGRQNTQQTTRKTRSSNRKTAAEKVTKDSKSKKPAKVSSKVKKVKAAITKTDNGTSELKDLSTSKTKTHNQKLQMFIDEPTNEQPTKPDKVPIPVFDPYEEVWHDKGPNRIYLPDSHFATNMMSAEVEWDLAQDPKRRGDPMFGPTDPRSCLNPLKRPRRPPVSGQSHLTLPEISSKYNIDMLRETGIFKQ